MGGLATPAQHVDRALVLLVCSALLCVVASQLQVGAPWP
jgi:hypothetical protein